MTTYAFPGIIEDEILAIGAGQVPYMRTAEFSEINKESERLLMEFVGCPSGRALIYTGSGTGAMDAVVCNYVSTRRRALVIDGGSFGHRWSQLCDYYGCEHTDMKLGFGQDVDYKELERLIEVDGIDTLLCQHHETSSGQLYDIMWIGDICRRHNVSLVVDIISSFLVEDFDMNAVGADICITSSQKGLNIPPGIAIMFLSPRMADYPFAHNSYYFDFQDNLKNMTRGQTPFSPATLLFLQLNARLKALKAEGIKANKARARERAQYFRGICEKYGWKSMAETPSWAITGFQTSGDPQRIVRGLIERFDTFIMPGSRPGFFRVSHMGIQSHADLDELGRQIHLLETE